MTLQTAPLPAGVARPLAVMHQACFPDDPWDTAIMARLLVLPGVFGYLGWQADDPVGFVLARDLAGEIEILSLGVLPAFRRLGAGLLLLEAIAADARRRQAGSLVLEVAVANEPARRLYASAGFIQVGRRPRYYRQAGQLGDGLILRRELTDAAATR